MTVQFNLIDTQLSSLEVTSRGDQHFFDEPPCGFGMKETSSNRFYDSSKVTRCNEDSLIDNVY